MNKKTNVYGKNIFVDIAHNAFLPKKYWSVMQNHTESVVLPKEG